MLLACFALGVVPVSAETEGVHTTFLDDAATSIGISWLGRDAEAPGVRYGLSPAALELGSVATERSLGAQSLYQAKLTELKPGTTYYYQCRSGESGNVSRVCSFRTAPAAGQPVTFAVLGDIQVKGHDLAWRRAASWIADKKPDFCVSLGDQVDKGLLLDQWKGLFADGAPLFESMVFMPVVGNHDCYETNGRELNPALYLQLFQLPENQSPAFSGQWYSFHAGVAAFSMLAAYPARNGTPCDVRKVPEQSAWLETTLSRQSSKDWKFVAFHPPVYSTGPHGGDTVWFNTLWGEILERNRVAIVFNGHTHAFEITHPIRQGKCVTDGRGIIYYNAAGVTFSSPATSNAFTAAFQHQEREPLVLLVTATEERLVLSTWNIADNVVIHEQIVIRQAAPSRLPR